MELDYEYGFSVSLVEELPSGVVAALTQVAGGEALEEFPATGADESEVAEADVFRLLTVQAAGGLAEGVSFRHDDEEGAWHLRCWGTAPDASFFMPFPALAEWLAGWAAASGWVGYYHRRSLDHPTMIYFAAGKVYMLQVTGLPVGMVDGEPFPPPEEPAAEEDWAE